MSRTLEPIMERASAALASMDYLTCEALCLEALAIARQSHNWADYGRVLLPLQEARRQRRMIAAEGVVRLGSSNVPIDPDAILDQLNAGCILLTHPHSAADAARLQQAAIARRVHVEVLLSDNPADADRWTLRSFAGPAVSRSIAPPRADWVDRWLSPPGEAADYFLDAAEALGDAALAQVQTTDARQRLAQLEDRLAVVTDHEILHQRLGDAAKALRTGVIHERQ